MGKINLNGRRKKAVSEDAIEPPEEKDASYKLVGRESHDKIQNNWNGLV